MDRQELAVKVSERTGMDIYVCRDVINGLAETCEHCGDSFVDKIKGMADEHNNIFYPETLGAVSDNSGYSLEVCEKVFDAIKEEVDPGVLEKLKFWKHHG